MTVCGLRLSQLFYMWLGFLIYRTLVPQYTTCQVAYQAIESNSGHCSAPQGPTEVRVYPRVRPAFTYPP